MKPVFYIITLSIFGCSSLGGLSLKDIIYHDGINKEEAKSIAYDYLYKNSNYFCSYARITDLFESESVWRFELGCNLSSGNKFYSSNVLITANPGIGSVDFLEGGYILVDKKTGNVERTRSIKNK